MTSGISAVNNRASKHIKLYCHILVLYCIVSIVFYNLYSASCSAHQSEALPVPETQREETCSSLQ